MARCDLLRTWIVAHVALCLFHMTAQGLRTTGLPLKVKQRAPCAMPADKDSVVGSVVLSSTGDFEFHFGELADAVAWGVYVDSAHTASNFGKLRVVTSPSFPDRQQMYAAGLVEGYLTAERIWFHYNNLKSYFVDTLNASLDEPMEWFVRQDRWVRESTAKELGDDPSSGPVFWRFAGLMTAQFDGLVAGYQAASQAAAESGRSKHVGALSPLDMLFVNSNGDLYDVLDFLEAGYRPDYDTLPADKLFNRLALAGKCSALIKVTADLSDILFGHSTWDTYTAMTHIYKHYDFKLSDPAVASPRLSFSSYPGELFSDDDFYLTGAGLAVMETTNHIFNTTLLQGLTHESVLSWQRVRIANLGAVSGESWIHLFSSHNSGTYNNQYMVLDFNKFVKGLRLDAGLLWVVEQVPGLVQAGDMTVQLERGYWPSYNVPFFPIIYNMTGYPEFIEKTSKRGLEYDTPARWLMYQASPRANILRRDQGGVSDLGGLKRLMRYNSWQNDTLSSHHPVAAICGRGDLAPSEALPKGCYDSKVSSWSLARTLEAEVVNGPTSQAQEPFEWTDRWSEYSHQGMPQRYDFKFERMSAAALPLPSELARPCQQPAAESSPSSSSSSSSSSRRRLHKS